MGDEINQNLADFQSLYDQMEERRAQDRNKQTSNDFLPKVSIIIPVFNGANYLSQAIESALLQTYPNFEVIVINDGSSDDGATETVARRYLPMIRYFSKPNGGVATALNLGIDKMTGEYFSWLSHDDLYKPEKIARQIDAVRESGNPQTIITESFEYVSADNQFLGMGDISTKYSTEKINNGRFCLLHGGIGGCALLIPKKYFERFGGFKTEFPTTQDFELWFRMFKDAPFRYLSSPDTITRIHSEQGTQKIENSKECSALWIHMASDLSDEERIAQSGSIPSFYYGVYDFLHTWSNYSDAIVFLRGGNLLHFTGDRSGCSKFRSAWLSL